MKVNVLLFLGVFLVLGIGSVCADSSMNLTGKWIEQKIEGLRYSGESLNSSAAEDYWTLTQKGNLVSGTNYFNDSTKQVQEPVAGSINPDGKTVYIVDSSGGTYIAWITDEDTITVNYINTGTKKAESNYAFTLFLVLKREE
jgi:hypothetical protein